MTKFANVLIVSLFAIGFAFMASAGSIDDTDTDLIPDVFDNCSQVANGPGEDPANQVDTNSDGFGNICDGDFDGDNSVTLTDFNLFLGDLGNPVTGDFDLNSDGTTDLTDLNIFFGLLGGPPGPGATAI